MTESFRTWWKTRTPREQRMLLAMLGVIALVLVWLLIIRPLDDALADARARHNDAVLRLADLRAQAAAIRQAQQGPGTGVAGPIDATVRQSATEAGFAVTRIDPMGTNQATLVMDTVRPQAFFGWVGQMESRGLIVDQLRASPNGDQTLAVQVTFRTRAG